MNLTAKDGTAFTLRTEATLHVHSFRYFFRNGSKIRRVKWTSIFP